MSWSVEGTYFEACNCLPICPCRQVGGRDGGRSTFGVCDFALSWWIRRGHAGDLDLTGRQVVMVGNYHDDEPGSPWTVALFIDDAADVEPLVWEWSDRCGFATKFVYRADPV